MDQIKKFINLANRFTSIQNKIDNLIESETGFSRDLLEGSVPAIFDIAVITATAEEFESIENILENFHEVKIKDNDSVIYFEGEIQGANKRLKVLVPFPQSMGMTAASNITTKILEFHPSAVFIIGIAAGNKNLSKIGDVLIAEKSINYDEVVETARENDEKAKKKFMQNASSIEANLKSKLTLLKRKLDFNDMKSTFYDNEKIKNLPKCLIGTIVTGSTLVRSQEKVKEINDSYHGVIGLDMETFGIYYVCSNSTEPKPKFVSIKSVSDFGDNSKSNLTTEERKEYALHTSSYTFKKFVEQYI